jgi:tartrate dehydratase alpha subunit/fumarate hydratase class I-like protein
MTLMMMKFTGPLERELLEEINKLGIGAAGTGGITSALAVKNCRSSYKYCNCSCSNQFPLLGGQKRWE